MGIVGFSFFFLACLKDSCELWKYNTKLLECPFKIVNLNLYLYFIF